MEFGIQIEPQFGFSYDSVLEIAHAAVKNGFSTLWFSDHFMLDREATDKVLIDPWVLMAALVRNNREIRVGSMVFCNSYRNPALTAKMAASLDVISEGRFEFGYGAGWKKIEYEAYGYDFPPDHTRIDQLEEAVQIIRGIWTNERFTFTGSHYSVRNLISFPKPYQKNPRIWIGTMKARQRMLELAAKYADGINIAWSFTPEMCEDIFKTLGDLCEQNGRKRSSIQRSVGLWTRCFESPDDMEHVLVENAQKRGVTLDDYRRRVESSLWGTPEALTVKLQRYSDIGIHHVILMLPYGHEIEQIEMIGNRVLPLLK